MRLLMALVLIVALVVGVFWFVRGGTLQEAAHEARTEAVAGAHQAKDAVSKVDVDAIKDELQRTGRVVRRKAQSAAAAVADATQDTRTTAHIKAKLAVDARLSPFDISVNTTNGIVTLSGQADSPEAVAQAMNIALAEDGVIQVVSTLQVSQNRS